ncbi:MAG: hypothetical protein HQK54_12225, partial [Oligoflexales bacterium]|nr:hypothetical protein [Oligoflexales bacterium]
VDLSRTTPYESDRLSRIRDLAPGDFKVVYQKALLALKSEVTISGLIQDLENEVKYKKHERQGLIGFGSKK